MSHLPTYAEAAEIARAGLTAQADDGVTMVPIHAYPGDPRHVAPCDTCGVTIVTPRKPTLDAPFDTARSCAPCGGSAAAVVAPADRTVTVKLDDLADVLEASLLPSWCDVDDFDSQADRDRCCAAELRLIQVVNQAM